MNDEKTVQTSEAVKTEATATRENREDVKKRNNVKTIIAVVVIAQAILAVFSGAFFFKSGYNNAKTNTVNKIRQDTYDKVYNFTENANHTSNRAFIKLDQLREKADLQVLQIRTSYLYTSDAADQAKNLTIWYKIPGTGCFTVDLQLTEFIVDADRNHVLVRAPMPALTTFDEGKPEKLEYKDDRFIFHGSIQEGETIARKMLYNAHIEMMRGLESNAEYLKAAKDSAQKLIANMIRSLNPSNKDLSVTIEFVDNM